MPQILRTTSWILFALFVFSACGEVDPAAQLDQIERQQAAGDMAGTLEPLRALLEKQPGDSRALYLYGRALALTGQPSLAEWSLREAMNDPEYLERAGMQLAFGDLRTGNLQEAIETTSKILEAEPDNVDVLVMRANAYAHSRMNHDRALEDVAHVQELAPDNVEILEPKIISLLGLERIDEAAEAIEELGRKIESSDVPGVAQMAAWHCATTALFADESDEKELADERWTGCLEKYPESPNVVTNGVQFYDERQDYDRSLEILRAAHAAAPDSRDFRVLLAERLRISGAADEAEKLLLSATETDVPQLAAGAWLDIVKHYQAVEDYGAAADAASRAVEIARQVGPLHPQLLFDQADALVIAGRLDQAEAVTHEMTLPAHREMILARIAQERGDDAKALEHFDEAFRLWPDNPWARYFAALAAEKLGDFDRAADAYRYSLRIAPEATDSRTRLARQTLDEGHPVDALMQIGVKSKESPLELEGELLMTRLFAQAGRAEQMRQRLLMFQAGSPQNLGRALAAAAEGARARGGAAVAVRMLRTAEKESLADFADPLQAPALKALVRYAAEAGELDDVRSTVRSALDAQPDSAEMRSAWGLWLELHGDADAAREAYAGALEASPDAVDALLGSGRLAADPAAALEWFEKAVAADPDGAEPARLAARALVDAGRAEEGEARFDALLADHPHDAEAAAAFVKLQLDRGVASDHTLERANRAVRFGGGAEALDLLARVHEQRGETQLATDARNRANSLREHREG